MSLTQLDFRKAMGTFATGVTVITVDDGGEVHGMTANAFTSVSLDPMLVLVCVDHRARTHAHLHCPQALWRKRTRQPSETDFRVLREIGRAPPARGSSRAPVSNAPQHGTPVLQDAIAYLECRLHTAQDAGDHTIFIAEVEDVVVRDGEPLALCAWQVSRMSESTSETTCRTS